jgi:arsenate reductase
MSKPNVLILCTHNAARSQMAEALLRHRAGDRFNVYSAGTEATRVHPLAIRACNEIGLDMTDHRSKVLTEYLGRLPVRYLITVCDNAAASCPSVWPGVEHRVHWPFPDPSATEGSQEQQLQAFRDIRDQIDEQIQQWLARLGTARPTASA